MTKVVTIVDYGRGNLFSVSRAIEMAGGTPVTTSDPDQIARAGWLLLPGVGAFGDAIAGLRERGLIEPLQAFATSGRPLLGICLGMQLLADISHEFGEHQGLGLIAGTVERLPHNAETRLSKVPNVGWCRMDASRSWSGTLLDRIKPGEYTYFVHSYHFVAASQDTVLATYDFGGRPVVAVVQSGSVTGCQFHPEKSGPAGARVIQAWLER